MRTVMKFVTAFAIATLTAFSALAGNMAARFGNTVVATYPDGTVSKFYYNADKTFTAKAEKSGAVLAETAGTWRQDGANVCITANANFGLFEAGKERCIPLGGDKVGDTWQVTAKDSTGKDITVNVKLEAGHV